MSPRRRKWSVHRTVSCIEEGSVGRLEEEEVQCVMNSERGIESSLEKEEGTNSERRAYAEELAQINNEEGGIVEDTTGCEG